VFLVRDGALFIGQRPIPLAGEPKDLHLGNGLIEVEPLPALVTDPNFRLDPAARPPERKQFRLTLKGRPDLKPGDLVRFDPPELEIGKTLPEWTGVIGELLSGPLVVGGGVSSSAARLYAASVDHRLGRRSGFVTTVTGVVIAEGEDGWDTHTPTHLPGTWQADTTGPETTAEGRAARAIADQLARALDCQRFPEVGEIREMRTTGGEDPPAQTVRVRRGLASPDGRAHGARAGWRSSGPARCRPAAWPT
jgi:hypothetical protein